MSARTMLLGVSVPLLAGCAVGPTYNAPSKVTPAQWTSPLAAGETDTAPALAAWWKNFGDTNLDRLVNAAVQSNLTLHVAEARVREARAEREVVAGGRLPSAGARLPTRTIAMAPTAFRRCLPARRWITIFTAPASMPHGNSTFSAASSAPSRPPTLKSALRNMASATCWSRCSRKSRAITSKRVLTSNASPSRETKFQSSRKLWT